MQCRCSRVILLGQEHRAVVEQVGIRVVSVDQENFGNISASRPALDMDDHVQGVGAFILPHDVNTLRRMRMLRALAKRGIECDGPGGITVFGRRPPLPALSSADFWWSGAQAQGWARPTNRSLLEAG